MSALPARFVSFEGGEGSGKSTQARLLADALRERGIAATLTREPGGEEGAEAIRRLLVEGAPDRWEPPAELLLFLAARAQHYHRTIVPALARGEWVISDRFHDSSRVYQGVARGLGRAYYDLLHAAVLGNASPDLTLYLDITPEEGLARASARPGRETRFEALGLAFHHAVRDGFLAIARAEPERVWVIDAAAGDPARVFASVARAVGL